MTNNQIDELLKTENYSMLKRLIELEKDQNIVSSNCLHVIKRFAEKIYDPENVASIINMVKEGNMINVYKTLGL